MVYLSNPKKIKVICAELLVISEIVLPRTYCFAGCNDWNIAGMIRQALPS